MSFFDGCVAAGYVLGLWLTYRAAYCIASRLLKQ